MPNATIRAGAFPAFNIWENAESYYVEAECPGYGIEDLELTVVQNQLTVSGERKDPDLPEGTAFHRRERRRGRFNRMITLPTELDADKVHASLKEGVLTIQLPKAETAKPRRIQVQS